MPLRKFKCNNCQAEWDRIIKGTNADCPECGLSANALLPTEISSATYEMRDKYRGTQIRKNQEQRMRKRMNDHHDKNEVAEKIDKHGMDDAVRNGWLKRIKKI
jgi:predicted  nucleic acid-binding Zn-ribbon protein